MNPTRTSLLSAFDLPPSSPAVKRRSRKRNGSSHLLAALEDGPSPPSPRLAALRFASPDDGGLRPPSPRSPRLAALRFASLAALLLLSGCYKATFVADARVPDDVEPTHEQWNDFFLFGTTGTAHTDVRSHCPGGAAVVRTGGNVGTMLLAVITIGIYTPRKTYITCAPSPVHGVPAVPPPPQSQSAPPSAPSDGEGGAP